VAYRDVDRCPRGKLDQNLLLRHVSIAPIGREKNLNRVALDSGLVLVE
jgi:hypothetical protein